MAGYMFIDDEKVKGEVTQGMRGEFVGPNGKKGAEFYHEWIELHSITQTVTRSIETGRSGTARARAACVLEDIEIEKEVDASSMGLIEAVSGGKAWDTVVIHLCSSSEDADANRSLHPYLEFRLFSVKVTSYTINGSGLDDGSIPVETINLNFDTIAWRYWPMGPIPSKMNVGPNFVHNEHIAGWDLVKASSFVAGPLNPS